MEIHVLMNNSVICDGYEYREEERLGYCNSTHREYWPSTNHLASSGILNTREKREEIEFDFIRVVKFPTKRFAR